jgi:hypothetical protein
MSDKTERDEARDVVRRVDEAASVTEATAHSHYRSRKADLKDEGEASGELSADAPDSSSPDGKDGAHSSSFEGRATSAQPPEELEGLSVKRVGETAGGVAAVVSALKHAWGEMGVVRGTRTLLELNQKGGFDCPGCAWPDPDGHRSHAEFCENGAKHVADEATTKRVTPEFFKRWSVADLALKSDYGLG